MMRVALYNHTSSVSGAEINLLVTASHLDKTHPILFAPEGDLLQRARRQGIEAIALPGYSARLSTNPFLLAKGMLGMMRAGWRFASAVKRNHIDLIHANSMRAGIMAALFGWYHHIPVVWHLHDIPPKGIIGQLIKAFAMMSTHSFIAISRPVLYGMYHPSHAKRFHLVHNGTELKPTSEMDRYRLKKNIRQELQTPMDSSVMTIIGQITPWKRQEDAITALHALLEQGKDVYLWIVGEPKFRADNELYWNKLKQLAAELQLEDRIRFTGFRDHIEEVCCAADLLLLCSDNEPFGRVIIEAMGQGTPVIATRGGGVPEIIEHGESGLMYKTADIEFLVQCIQTVLEDKRLWLKLSKNGQQRVREHFSIERAAARIELVYEQMIESGNKYKSEHSQAQPARGMTE